MHFHNLANFTEYHGQAPGQNNNTTFQARIPDSCPLCKKSCTPLFFGSAVNHPVVAHTRVAEVVWRCTNPECHRLFIARQRNAEIDACYPMTPQKTQFDPKILEVSPDFGRIFNEAEVAEAHGLAEVCGTGYRKALEFLVKDFAIKKQPHAEKEIRADPLAKCIQKFIANESVKNCARRAAWLGNDETHYQRKWAEMKLSDLKILINLVVTNLLGDLQAEEYEEMMPEGG